MRITNATGEDRFLPAVGRVVAKGETVDIDGDEGQSLVEQGWTSAAQKAARKRARRQRAETSPPDDGVGPADDDHAAGEADPGDEPATTPEADPADPQED